jgi:hypothetical protein
MPCEIVQGAGELTAVPDNVQVVSIKENPEPQI